MGAIVQRLSSTPRTQPLPRGWTRSVRSAVLHTISLAHYASTQAYGKAAVSISPFLRMKAENQRLRQTVAQLQEEVRIKDARTALLPPQRRPHYPPAERMAILELRAARGWSLAQTARTFLVTPLTIAQWLRRLEEQGPQTLVQLREPVNKFPEFVGYLVRRLKTLCPTLGKKKIAQMLARAGLHLGTTTVGRMLKQAPSHGLEESRGKTRGTTDRVSVVKRRVVTAKRPNHVWHADLTVVPITGGFWTAWSPFALPQCWHFCWWVAVSVDHFSRRVMGTATFYRQPTSEMVRAFLGRTIRATKATPKYLICDRGPQFDCHGFRNWCRHRNIRPRFGAVEQHGSIAVVERFILTLKQNCTRRLTPVPFRRDTFHHELALFCGWYNEARPHATLAGQTPDEVYHRRFPAVHKPRYEPRARWPRGSPCSKPWALQRGKPGARLELHVELLAGRKHLPIVTLRRVA
jgi:putative transposase